MKKYSARLFGLLCCVLATSPFVGCYDDGLNRVGVSGKVLYKGQPLEGAEVMFRPQFGPNSGSTTDATGVYKVDRSFGPVSGSCEVRVTKLTIPEGEEYARNILPVKFSSSPMVVKFEEGQNTLDIDLDQWD